MRIVFTAVFITAVFFCATSNSQSFSDGLLAKYTFSGNSLDVSGNGNNLVGNDPAPQILTNAGTTTFVEGAPVLVDDRFGNPESAYSITFGQYLFNPSVSFNFSSAQDYTFSLWTKYSGDVRPYPFLLALRSGSPSSNDGGMAIITDQDQAGSFAMDFAGAPKTVAQFTPQTNVWYMSTVTINSGSISYFVDGQLFAQSTVTNSSEFISSPMLIFGNEFWWFQADYSVDDVSIYNRALSSGDVAQLYSIESVPEPSTYALLLLGGAASVWFIKRRRC
jgi:hypothetical protein